MENNVEDPAEILFKAVRNWDLEGVKQLLDSGVDVNIEDENYETALLHAAYTGNVRMIKLLLDRGAKINHMNGDIETALHISINRGHKIIVELLLERGANVNTEDYYSKTAVNNACENGNLDIVKLLLNYGAKIHTIDNRYKDTILHDAVVGHNMDVMRLLLKLNLNIDRKNEFGETALFTTAQENRPNILEFLLDHGANVHETNLFGENIVYAACKRGRGDILKALVAYEVDFNFKTSNGFNAFTAALRNEAEQENSHWKRDSAVLAFTQCAVLLRHKNIPIPENILKDINKHESASTEREKCETEITRMKNTVIEDSTVSFFDLLTSNDLNHLASCTRNDLVVQMFSSSEYKTMFPCYHSVLINQFRRGVYRKLLLDKVKYFFPAVSNAEGNEGLPTLPKTCIDNIFHSFTNMDLRNLIKVCDPFNEFNTEICDIQ